MLSWTYLKDLAVYFTTEVVVMTRAVSYLLVCEGCWAVSHEPEDHLQSSRAAVARLPTKGRFIHQTYAQNGSIVSACLNSSYVVDVVYTTLLLIVLFERAVAMEFSVETQKGSHSSSRRRIFLRICLQCLTCFTRTTPTTCNDPTDKSKHQRQHSVVAFTPNSLFLHIPHDVVVDLHEGCCCVQSTKVCVYDFSRASCKQTLPATWKQNADTHKLLKNMFNLQQFNLKLINQ